MIQPLQRGIVDTSVFIAREAGRPLDEWNVPREIAISPVTVAELHVGVLAAADVETRARRLSTLQNVADVEVLRIDEDVAARWAELRVHLAQSERRINVNTLWIAATAVVHGLPVVTQDDDFEPLIGVAGVEVLRV